MMRALGISAATAAMATAAIAQDKSPFDMSGCPEQTGYGWCASRAADAGWRLKYQDTNPPDLQDRAWRFEVWVRGHEAMLCEFHSSYGAIRDDNGCHALQEAGR